MKKLEEKEVKEEKEEKICAMEARRNGVVISSCKRERAEGSLFCSFHKYAGNRLYLPRFTTAEELDDMNPLNARNYDGSI